MQDRVNKRVEREAGQQHREDQVCNGSGRDVAGQEIPPDQDDQAGDPYDQRHEHEPGTDPVHQKGEHEQEITQAEELFRGMGEPVLLLVSAQVRRAQLFFSKIADYLLNALIFSTNSGASICPNAS